MSNDDIPQHYRKVIAAEEQLEANALLDYYIELYKKKYRGVPIFPKSNAHLTLIKDFKKTAKERAYQLLEHYFEMRDDWFINQAYSLECLVKQLHKVAASHSLKAPKVHLEGTSISAEVSCTTCGKAFTVVRPMKNDAFDAPFSCEECTNSGKTPSKMSHKERMRIILGMGRGFPAMPVDAAEERKEELLAQLQNPKKELEKPN